jgi:hypothetical protein
MRKQYFGKNIFSWYIIVENIWLKFTYDEGNIKIDIQILLETIYSLWIKSLFSLIMTDIVYIGLDSLYFEVCKFYWS